MLSTARGSKHLIAHRGASAYAPENTLPALDLALRQGADTLEHDLQVTKDGVLICLHDVTLERTTNVREVFPTRGRPIVAEGRRTHQWFVYDFTLAEIQQLDAGSWFGPAFAGTRIPTFQDLIDFVGHRGALLSELKDPDIYERLGIDQVALFATVVRRNGFATGGATPARVTAQSFHLPTVRRGASAVDGRLPWVLLIEPIEADRWARPGQLRLVREFAVGIGPGKSALDAIPNLVQSAHACGLRVTPWTFDASVPGRFATVRDEMAHFLAALDVDAVITNNPDQCPRDLLAR